MNRYKTALIACAVLASGGVALAQPVETTQASVGGATGDATYSVRVIGQDGVAYNCRPDLTTVNGAQARLCRRAGGAGSGGLEGGTLAPGTAAAIGVVAIAVVAGSGGSSSTTTTGSLP